MLSTLNSLARYALPIWVYHRLIGDWNKDSIKRYLANTGWLFFTKLLSFVISFFTIAIVARYLGPENYGKLSYAQSFVSIFSIFASFGIDLIVYRDLVAHPDREHEIIGTAIFTKLFFGAITLVVTFGTAYFFNEDVVLTWLIGIIALGFILQPFSTVGHIFNARVLSKYPSYIGIAVALLIPVLKLVVIFFDKGILYFAAILTVEALVSAIALVGMYIYVIKQSPLEWRFSFPIFNKLFTDSWPLLLAGFSGYIYAKIDQVMIQHYIDSTAVGLYEVAVRLTEPLSFLPGVIIGSLFPAVMRAKTNDHAQYKKRLRSLSILCLSISFILVVILFIFAPFIIQLLFGQEFSRSTDILRIYVWTNLGTVATSLIYNYFVTENRTKTFLAFTAFGAAINVSANMVLIPALGMIGAAYATLFTLFCICVVFLFMYRNILAPLDSTSNESAAV